MDPLLPFSQRTTLDASLRPPRVVSITVALGLLAGALLGFLEKGTPEARLLRGSFFASAFAYLVVSLFDFWEHFRLEKAATGRSFSATVIPLGETLNHAATGLVITLMLALGRPLPPSLEPRDWLVLASPLLFLALGWRDELVYHRRRCAHREDLMHTVAHLAAGVMIATFLASTIRG